MWWQFRAAFVRKLAYMLVGALFALVLGYRAHSQTLCYAAVSATLDGWGGVNGSWSTYEAAAAAAAAAYDASNNGLSSTSVTSCSPSGAATASSSTCQFNGCTNYPANMGYPTNSCGLRTGSVGTAQITCPQNACAGLQNQDLLATLASSTSIAGGTMCSGGCQYSNGNNTLTIGASSNRFTGQAVPTGSTCGSSDPPAVAASCVSKGGSTTCVQDTPLEAVVNGDTVSPGVGTAAANVPASGSCIAFSSGGAMCTVPLGASTTVSQSDLTTVPAMPSPPGPDNGTAGMPATPDAVIVGGGKAVDYYKPSTVAASSSGVLSSGVTATGTGTTTGTSTTSGTGTGTCPAGQTCTGTTDATSGGLDCATPPSCTDTDPVVCGVQNQVWLLRCENPQESQLASSVNEGGSIPVVNGGDFSTATSEEGVFSGGGSCPAPKVVTIMGSSLTLDWWQPVCDFAGYISGMIMLLAYVVAARIMFVGVTGGQVSS